MKSAFLAFLALATSNWALCVADNQVKAKQAKGKEVDCSRYFQRKGQRTLACPRNYQPLCGTNQQNYSNECLLCDFNLKKSLNIRKLHDGECIQCPNEERQMCTMEYSAHCASDGIVYGNKCVFCNAFVKSRGAVTFVQYGDC